MKEGDKFKPNYHNFACSSFVNYSQFSWYIKKGKTQEINALVFIGASAQS